MITQVEITELESFFVAGISKRTTNQNNQASTDIHKLWNRLLNEDLVKQLGNRVSDDIYSVYTDYSGDHTQAYSVILGCKVNKPDELPDGFISVAIPAGKYEINTIAGKMPDSVKEAWQEIWETRNNRAYTADFEVYGSEEEGLKIYLAVK